MASVNKGSSEESISDINIVPLVDIILVVLIIFMVTVPTAVKPSMDLNLPEAASGETKESTVLNFYVTQEGSVFHNNIEVTEEDVKKISVEELNKNPEVTAVVSADKNLAYGRAIELLDWIKSSGIKTLSVTTDSNGNH